MASPASWKVADALKRVPFIVSFGSFIDETSALADLILPDHSFLESWVDAAPESGSAKAVPTKFGPVMRPLYDTRSTPDVLLEVSRKLAKPSRRPAEHVRRILECRKRQPTFGARALQRPQRRSSGG